MVSESPIHDDVADLLRRADQRYSTGRRRVVDVLLAADGPVTIAQVLDQDRRLAQSSVYRNLAILEQVGAVTRIVTRDDYARYELTERLTDHHHHHLICGRCGDVSDFSLTSSAEADLDVALAAVADQAGFRAEGHRLDLVGVCSDCD